MKQLAISFVAVLGALCANAQYLPTTGQPFQFAPVYNPAFTAMDPFGDIKLSYRSQIGNSGANSPSFFNGMYQFRLNSPVDANLNGPRTSITNDRAARSNGIIHGLGVNVFDEQLGIMSRMGGGISYSFHFPISPKWMVAIGTSGMIENLRIDMDKVYLGAAADPDPIYEQLMAGKSNSTQINLRAGAVLYSNRFYLGMSYLPIWKYNLQDTDFLTGTSAYKATLQTGVSIPVSETVDLKPSIVALLNAENKLNMDYGLKVFVKNIVWAGAAWRGTGTGVGQLGYNINKTFSAAYSYEISTGAWKFDAGSHEIVLAVRLNNFRNQSPWLW
jgi:type IX secretion system PorP/SprF family membrane protein